MLKNDGTHPRELNENYPMNTNMTGFSSTVASHPFLEFRLTRELENFRWYHVLGPHLGHTARVDVDFRSGAHLFYGVMS